MLLVSTSLRNNYFVLLSFLKSTHKHFSIDLLNFDLFSVEGIMRINTMFVKYSSNDFNKYTIVDK